MAVCAIALGAVWMVLNSAPIEKPKTEAQVKRSLAYEQAISQPREDDTDEKVADEKDAGNKDIPDFETVTEEAAPQSAGDPPAIQDIPSDGDAGAAQDLASLPDDERGRARPGSRSAPAGRARAPINGRRTAPNNGATNASPPILMQDRAIPTRRRAISMRARTIHMDRPKATPIGKTNLTILPSRGSTDSHKPIPMRRILTRSHKAIPMRRIRMRKIPTERRHSSHGTGRGRLRGPIRTASNGCR